MYLNYSVIYFFNNKNEEGTCVLRLISAESQCFSFFFFATLNLSFDHIGSVIQTAEIIYRNFLWQTNACDRLMYVPDIASQCLSHHAPNRNPDLYLMSAAL